MTGGNWKTGDGLRRRLWGCGGQPFCDGRPRGLMRSREERIERIETMTEPFSIPARSYNSFTAGEGIGVPLWSQGRRRVRAALDSSKLTTENSN
jgi:hypothetical protein